MRYKFSLAPKIKGYVEWQLEHYHEDKRQMEEYKRDMMPPGIANYSGMWGGSEPGDPTATTVERIVTSPYIITTERNVKAVDRALMACDDETKRIIDLVYWRRTHTVTGAANCINLGKTAAYDRINSAICHIALEMGLVSL